MIVLVSGVAGSGKTTVGAALAERLGWDFIEGDALHPPANVARMGRGEPLRDVDREPWLAALRREIEARLPEGIPAVVATSALKRRYREQLLADDPRVLLAFLDISPELARRRLVGRGGHFFSADLVDSQFAALEPPSDALVLPADVPVSELVDALVAAVETRRSGGAAS